MWTSLSCAVFVPFCAAAQAGLARPEFVCCCVQLGNSLQVLVVLTIVKAGIWAYANVLSNRTCLGIDHLYLDHCHQWVLSHYNQTVIVPMLEGVDDPLGGACPKA
jgi:hypothetical protein